MLDTRAPPTCRLPLDTRHNDPAEIEGEASVEKAAPWLQRSQAIRIAESADNLDHSHEFIVHLRRVNAEQRQQQGVNAEIVHDASAFARGSGMNCAR